MRINEQLRDTMYLNMSEQLQVSKLSFTERQFNNWCYTINEISGMNYRKKTIEDFLIEDYLIPQALEQLVIPRKISFESGDDFADLRDPEYDEANPLSGELLDATQFTSISKGIQASQRKGQLAMKDLQTLSSEALVSTIGNRWYTDGDQCLRGAELFVPISLTVNPVADGFLTMKNTAMFKIWFNRALLKIAEG